MSQLVPLEVRERILQQIVSEADAADWDHLIQTEKTAMIGRWVRSVDIGGVLRPLLGGDAEIRVWLKEVALKHRSKAHRPTAKEITSRLFPQGCRVVESSIKEKPPQCIVETSSGRHFVCWGDYRNAKHLFWAALDAKVSELLLNDAYIVIVEHGASITPPDRRARYERIADLSRVKIAWTSVP